MTDWYGMILAVILAGFLIREIWWNKTLCTRLWDEVCSNTKLTLPEKIDKEVLEKHFFAILFKKAEKWHTTEDILQQAIHIAWFEADVEGTKADSADGANPEATREQTSDADEAPPEQ